MIESPATRLVPTAAGPVEIVRIPGARPPVLFFPGGHCSAGCDCGWSLYTSNGHGVLAFSRPGYGGTDVGALTAAQFAPLVAEVCESLGVERIAAAVGVSFGGMQAVETARLTALSVPRLVLHSAAPSRLDYPDRPGEAVGGRIVFAPGVQGIVWRMLGRVVRSDRGLRRVWQRLSTVPAEQWWSSLTAEDKDEARRLFLSMRSDAGFAIDLRQGGRKNRDARAAALSDVACPTLITGSRHDGGVAFAHAEDLARAIPDATLLELDSPTHLFWIGAEAEPLARALVAFLD